MPLSFLLSCPLFPLSLHPIPNLKPTTGEREGHLSPKATTTAAAAAANLNRSQITFAPSLVLLLLRFICCLFFSLFLKCNDLWNLLRVGVGPRRRGGERRCLFFLLSSSSSIPSHARFPEWFLPAAAKRGFLFACLPLLLLLLPCDAVMCVCAGSFCLLFFPPFSVLSGLLWSFVVARENLTIYSNIKSSSSPSLLQSQSLVLFSEVEVEICENEKRPKKREREMPSQLAPPRRPQQCGYS